MPSWKSIEIYGCNFITLIYICASTHSSNDTVRVLGIKMQRSLETEFTNIPLHEMIV